MWNQIAEFPFIKTLGWGSIIIFIGTLVTQIRKLQPITTLSSTNVEKLLYSKEMRISVNMLTFLFHAFITTTISSGLCFLLYEVYTNFFNHATIEFFNIVTFVIFGFAMVSLLILFISANFKKGIIEVLFKSRDGRINSTLIILSIFAITSFCLFPNILVTSVITGNVGYKNNAELFAIFLAFLLVLTPVSSFNLVVLKRIWKLILKKLRSYSGEYYYILLDGNANKWFVYHQIEKDLFLIGDSELTEDSKVFKTIEKKELITKNIFVYRVLNDPEGSIEYSI
ncbi:hypothetical protein [Paenibacillus graminis]|uniref:Uncharacterized protein n=1 Tax=Paenibacillus graminis TaxID=189425 RepID=A0A089M4J1_9BACL|nr:hypothetical protein [Paenibacillus graminis]AIQ68701.1 hypothetical protein PGRAT_14585 [Paenibacillus graminis]